MTITPLAPSTRTSAVADVRVEVRAVEELRAALARVAETGDRAALARVALAQLDGAGIRTSPGARLRLWR